MKKSFPLTLFLAALTLGIQTAEAAEKTIGFQKIIKDGGIMMWVLIALSVVATILAVFFLLTLRSKALFPPSFVEEAEDLATQGDAEALQAACQENASPGARIVGAATGVLQAFPQADYSMLRNAMEDEGGRQAGGLWRRVQYLADIATIAPMVGLLGTVLGMIEAFVGLKDNFGAVKPIGLANGVSKALITTAGGLVVGIGAMLLYSFFRGRIGSLISLVEEQSNRILQLLLSNRSQPGNSPDQDLTALAPPVAEPPKDRPNVKDFDR